MKVAIPFWMERVSPVFDVAKQLLLVDIVESTEVTRQETTISETELISRANYVASLGVQALICGAISRPLERILEAKGIDVTTQICGDTEEILQAFLRGTLDDGSFRMPGCNAVRQRFQPRSDVGGNGLKPKEKCMRIAVTSQGPNLSSQVDPRFGRAKFLIVLDRETEEFTVLDNSRNLNATQGAGIQTAKRVVDEAVDAVITGHVGPKALEALQCAQVEIFPGASGTVKDALDRMKSQEVVRNART